MLLDSGNIDAIFTIFWPFILKKNVKGKKKVPQSKNALTILDCVFDILIVLSQFQKFITDRFSNRGFTDLAFGLRSDVDLLLFFSLYLYKGV